MQLVASWKGKSSLNCGGVLAAAGSQEDTTQEKLGV